MKNMVRLRENKPILVLLCCLAAVYVGMLALDKASETEPAALAFKYLGDVCCVLIVLSSWRNALNRRDIKILIAGFLFVLGADALFLFAGQIELGVICFCFGHATFIGRYRGIIFKNWYAALLAVLAFYVAGKFAGWKLPYVYIVSVIYGALLFLDAYYGFHSNLPRLNKIFVRIGMAAFILNDANNAVMYLFPPGSPVNDTAAYFVWVFYLPALAMLALSAYDYGHGKGASPGKIEK